MDKQREAFEAMWAVKPERHPGANTYVDSFINVAWQNFKRGWQAALSHAEGEAPFAWHRGGRAHEMLFADDLDGAPTDLSDGWEPLFKRPAPQVGVPEGYTLVPVKWLPMLSAPAPDEREIAAQNAGILDVMAELFQRLSWERGEPAAGRAYRECASRCRDIAARLRAGKEDRT